MCLLEGDEQRVLLKIVSHGRRRMRVSELTPLDLRGSVDTLPKLPIRIESSDEAVPAHLCCPSPWTSAKTALATELRTSRKLPPTYRVGNAPTWVATLDNPTQPGCRDQTRAWKQYYRSIL